MEKATTSGNQEPCTDHPESPVRRQPDGNRRHLKLLIGTACATGIGLAKGQSDAGFPEQRPTLLRPALSLSTPAESPADNSLRSTLPGLTRELSSSLVDTSPSTLLRSAQSLSNSRIGTAVRVKPAQPVRDSNRLSISPSLSLAADDAPQPSERPSPPAPVLPARARIESPDEPVAFEAVQPGERPPPPAQAATPQTKKDGPEDPVPFEAVRPGPPAPVSSSATPLPDNLPDLTSVTGWAVPPIRWGGNTTSNYNWNSSSGSKTFSETQAVNLRASSYIYQPWYAQVSGDVGLLTGTSKQSGGDSGETSSGRSTSMNYGGNLSLFPQSRFPFQAYLQQSDSRASANAQSQQYTSTRMGARQSYRPEVGPESYSGSADRSIVTAGAVRSVVDAFQGTYATTIADHNLGGSARYSLNTGDVGGQGSNLLSLSGTHSWRADEEFTVASSANYTKNEIRMLNGTGLSLNDSELMQASSSVTWLPDEDLPLTIVGGGNFLSMNTKTETAKADLTNLSGYANASYRFTNNLSAMAGLTLAQNQSNGVSQLASGQNASVSYSGNPLIFGDYSYNWGTGGGISNQMVSGGAANRSLSGQVQHSLLRNITLSDVSAITLNASQSFSLSDNSTSGQNGILTHSGGGSWRVNLGERTLGMLSATVSDSMSTGNYASHFRSFATQGSMQTQLSGRSALTASLNFVLSQQLKTPQVTQTDITGTTASPTSDGNSTLNGSGQVSYSHRSPFDIANLIYTATLQVNTSHTNLRLVTGDPNTLTSQTGTVFQNNLDYRLGRLMFRGTGSLATLNGKENASIFFMMGREIGDF